MANHLINEKSPYLLQHADNPVDWYPWGDEALALAKADNKPIFLSIGYSTCHWCHVMAHESFEDASTAEILNRHFINIKVDREERPDLDHLYMNTVQLLTGAGGWPLSVWLTPDLKPFYGATYVPRVDRDGQPAFKNLLLQIAEVWEKERLKVEQSAEQLTGAVQENARSGIKKSSGPLVPDVLIPAAFQVLEQSFDPQDGGFGHAPKFPMPVYLDFLLYYYERFREPKALHMVKVTCEKMARGGIHDQLGGGFARYATDSKWVVPHFEKMLYDNAQLISVYAKLFKFTGEDYFKNVAADAIRYTLRDLRHPDGGFYSAEDADSEGKEGTFYIWTLHQIKEALDSEAAEFILRHYGVTVNGNFFDLHTGEAGLNILTEERDVKLTAKTFGFEPAVGERLLAEARAHLLEIRSRRPRPQRDEKILTEWNGLMITALAQAGAIFDDSTYLQAAEQAASFVEANLYDASSGTLYRSWTAGERKVKAFQTDYACLVQGLLDLDEATGSSNRRAWAATLHDAMNDTFFDSENGGYFLSGASDLLFPIKESSDNVIPSGNSVAALNGIRLARLLSRPDLEEKSRMTVAAYSKTLQLNPLALLGLLRAAGLLQQVA